MTRKDYTYINFHNSFMELVDCCVSNVFYSGLQKYDNRKDFVTKAIQNLITKEQNLKPELKAMLAIIEEKNKEKGVLY